MQPLTTPGAILAQILQYTLLAIMSVAIQFQSNYKSGVWGGGKYELKEVVTINVEFQQVVVFCVIDLYADIRLQCIYHFIAEDDVCKFLQIDLFW